MMDKIWAAFLAILIGNGLVEYIFNHEEKPWSWIGPLIYFIFFLLTLYQIKTDKSFVGWMWERRKKRKAEEEKFWNQRVADGDI